MSKMFGLPVDSLAVVLAVLVGIGVAVIATLALRNRIFFRLGIRNVERRVGRSVLIVVGLMLATAIIASALISGDTMGRTVRSGVVQTLGNSDEWVTVKGAQPAFSGVTGASDVMPMFDRRVVATVDAALRGTALTDGVMPVVTAPVAVQNMTARQTEPRVTVFAPDPTRMQGFGTIRSTDGSAVDLATLPSGSVVLNRDAARALHAKAGDQLAVLLGSRRLPVTVHAVVDYTGAATNESAILLPLATAQAALGVGDRVSAILVSNRGGETGGAARTDAVVNRLRPVLARAGLEAQPFKRDGLKSADTTANAFTNMFSTFGSFSIAAGILLIFLIFVMLAAERRTEMGVARAIGTQRGHLVQTFLFEGAAYDLAAAALGALLGIGVSFAMIAAIGAAFNTTDEALNVVYTIRWPSVIVAYTLGVLLTFLVVAFSAWRVSVLNIVTAVRNLPDPKRHTRRRAGLIAGIAVIVFGALLMMSGRSASQAVSYMLGLSLVLIGVVPILRALHVPDRLAYTLAGVGLVVLWSLPFRYIETMVPNAQMDFSMWVLGGLLVVMGATWAVVYNADVLLGAATAVLGRIRSLAAVLKISMAYPLRTRLRTGMTLAMFTLVVFTLVVGSTTTRAFILSAKTEQAGGGFDVRATTAAPGDMSSAVRANGELSPQVRTVAAESYLPMQMRQQGSGTKYVDYPLRGLDATFLADNHFALATRAHGYTDDRAVWTALAQDPNLAVVDSWIVPRLRNWSFGNPTELKLSGFFAEDTSFTPVTLDVRDKETGRVLHLKVVGVLRDSAPFEMNGVSTSQATLAPFGDRARPTMFYFGLAPGTDASQFASRLESAFLERGLQADSFATIVHDAVSANMIITRLMQGFMGLGLVVGVAALGVIAARSVVERRQQIGVLRAIGFQKATVRLGFLLESGLVAVTSIVLGTALGLLMAYNVIDDARRSAMYSGSVSFVVPWTDLIAIFTIVVIVALATTYLPARRASKVYAAEALRYQ